MPPIARNCLSLSQYRKLGDLLLAEFNNLSGVSMITFATRASTQLGFEVKPANIARALNSVDKQWPGGYGSRSNGYKSTIDAANILIDKHKRLLTFTIDLATQLGVEVPEVLRNDLHTTP